MFRNIFSKLFILFITLIFSNNVINAAVGDTFSSNFTDQNLASDVARLLSKSTSDTISQSDVDRFTYYSLNTNKAVKDLTGIETFNKLTILNVMYNPIEVVPNSIYQLNNLETFRLSYGNLTSLPDDFGLFPNLKRLQLDNNSLTSLPASVANLTKLQDLYLSNNPLESLPEFNLDYPDLKSFSLTNTNLTSLPDTIGNLTSLTYFTLSHNKLESLPESFTRLTKLESLDVDSNELVALPESLGNMNKLKYINAYNNKIESLPDSIKDLSNLETIQLLYNNLTKIPVSIIYLDKLYYLDLRNNNVSEFPLELNQSKITALDLSGNNLTSVPEFINGLVNLDYLILDYNQITELPSFLSTDNIPKLYQVSLKENQIKSVPALKMPFLDVSKNVLVEAIPEDFEGNVYTSQQNVTLPISNYILDTDNPFDIEDIMVPIMKQYRSLNGGVFDFRSSWTITKPDNTQVVLEGGEEAQLNSLINTLGTYKITFEVIFMPERLNIYNNLQGSQYNYTLKVSDKAVDQTILEGIVYDKKTNTIIKDALVSIESNNTIVASMKTDALGKYKFVDLNAQAYNIVTSKNKYKSKTETITLQANTTNTKDIYLELETGNDSIPDPVKPPIKDETKKPLPDSGALNITYLIIGIMLLSGSYTIIKKV